MRQKIVQKKIAISTSWPLQRSAGGLQATLQDFQPTLQAAARIDLRLSLAFLSSKFLSSASSPSSSSSLLKQVLWQAWHHHQHQIIVNMMMKGDKDKDSQMTKTWEKQRQISTDEQAMDESITMTTRAAKNPHATSAKRQRKNLRQRPPVRGTPLLSPNDQSLSCKHKSCISKRKKVEALKDFVLLHTIL